MPLTKIQFRPGVNRETTSYGNENGWFNSDLIRFRKGRPEKMGGWERLSAKATAMESAIDGAANTEAVAALFLSWDADRNKSGILYDWPELG